MYLVITCNATKCVKVREDDDVTTQNVAAYRKIMSVQEELPEEFEGLSPGDIVVGVQQFLVVAKDPVKVGLEKLCRQHLVPRQQLLKNTITNDSMTIVTGFTFGHNLLQGSP